MYNLLILGEQHNFSTLELEVLHKKFSTLHFIKYIKVEPEDVISQISSILNNTGDKSLIVLNTKALVPAELLSYLTRLKQEEIKYISIQNFMEKYLSKYYVPNILYDITFLENVRPFKKIEKVLKTLIDYILSLTIILFTFPFMIYAVYKIRKESPGPILFKQKRVGLNGKEFTCIKFRSMIVDAEKNGAKFAVEGDERVYPWGKTMRATRIDELPQLWNVLKGDMHLIGPRPERKVWIDEFEKEIPYYNERHLIKPGLTGWAQVLYPYGANAYDAKQKLMYDLYYIKHWSLWLEVQTIWKTVMVVLSRKGV